MRINTNIAALNSYNQLNNTQNNLSKSLERLSSGKRINGAADDAAGLAISEKMGAQVRGLGQAQRNAQDGISMNQTAEGALKESHAILQRMRELAVQSANDTNTAADRAEIQEEVDELAAELTRIGETTEFNTQKLLDGTLENTFHIGSNEDQNMKLNVDDMRAKALGVAEAGGAEFDTTGKLENAEGPEQLGALSDIVEDSDLSDGKEVSAEFEAVEISETQVGEGDDAVDAEYALLNDDGEVVAVSEEGDNYQVLAEATDSNDLDNLTEFATGSDTNVATVSFDDRVIDDGEVAASLSIESSHSDVAANNATTDVNTDLAVADGENYDIISINTTTVSADGSGGSDVDAEYAWVNEQGEAVAVSASGDSYAALKEATAIENLDNAELAADTDNNENVTWDLSSNGATEGWISATDDSGTIDVDHFEAENGEVDFAAEANVETELEAGTYEVATEDDYDFLDTTGNDEYGLENEDGELVAMSDDDGVTWKSLDGEETVLESNAFDGEIERGDTFEVGTESGINVSTQDNADAAISTIDEAIGKVSSERSKLGAVQNRLEHTINNLNTAEENLTAAESRISDVDMAEEMMSFTKNQILSQAGTAMMAQANQLPQGVLQLLG